MAGSTATHAFAHHGTSRRTTLGALGWYLGTGRRHEPFWWGGPALLTIGVLLALFSLIVTVTGHAPVGP